MILVTRLNGSKFYINPELILTVEETPDTVITLTDHHRFVIKDRPEVVVERFIAYRQQISGGQFANNPHHCGDNKDEG